MLKTILIIITVVTVIIVLLIAATAIVHSGRISDEEYERFHAENDINTEDAEEDYYGLKDNEIYKDNGNPFHP